MKKIRLLPFCLLFSSIFSLLSSLSSYAQEKFIIPGEVWKDTEGNPINAHGGGILQHNGTYYWFGEIKSGKTWKSDKAPTWECYRVDAGGVNCYSSKDLINWKFEGLALAPNTTDTSHDLNTNKVIERPKVIYNRQTKKFVMWLHIDSETYSKAHSGVAVSDNPIGPYTYLGSDRPNGGEARDQTIFQDDDGKAYHIYSSENNDVMHITLLTQDYLHHTKNEKRIFIGKRREAPAMIRYQNKYYLFTSFCTGWSPNPAGVAVADNPLGPWKDLGNPCIGQGADSTFNSQSTFVIKVPNKKDAFIFLADRWNKTDLPNSRYVWLPLTIRNGKSEIVWKDKWNFASFK